MKKILLGALLMVPLIVIPIIAQDMTGMGKGKFSECVAVELYTLSPKHVNRDKEIEDTSKVPEGWTMVGGAGGGGHPTMVVCR